MTEVSGLEQWIIHSTPLHNSFPHIEAHETRLVHVNDFMTCGMTCNQYAVSDAVSVISELPSTQRAAEVKVDFYNGVLSEIANHLKHCEEVLTQMKKMQEVNQEELYDHLTAPNNCYGDGAGGGVISNDTVTSALENMYGAAISGAAKGAKESQFGWSQSMLSKARTAHNNRLQIMMEVVPEAIDEENGSGEYRANRVRCYACIIGDDQVNDKLTFDYGLKLIAKKNRDEWATTKAGKKKRMNMGMTTTRERQVTAAEKLMPQPHNRPVHTSTYDGSVTAFLDVAQSVINQFYDQTKAWNTRVARDSLCSSRSDMPDNTISPGDSCLQDGAFRNVNMPDVFSVHREWMSRPSEHRACRPNQYKQQGDERCYLAGLLGIDPEDNRDNKGEVILPSVAECANRMQSPLYAFRENHPECTPAGISLFAFPDDMRKNCFFDIPLGNFSTLRSHIMKQPFHRWWENFMNTAVPPCLGADVMFVPSTIGIQNAWLQEDNVDEPLPINEFKRPMSDSTQVDDALDRTQISPIEHLGKNTRGRMDEYDVFLQRLRKKNKELTSPGCSPEQRKRLTEQIDDLNFIPAVNSQRCFVGALLDGLSSNAATAAGTRAMAQAARSESIGYMGKHLQREPLYHLYAPDMEHGCNARQHKLCLYEYLGLASTHVSIEKLHSALLDSMIPHRKLFLNMCFYGYGQTGKDTMVDILKKNCSVDGTIDIFGYCSNLALLGSKPVMHCMGVYNEALDAFVSLDGKSNEVGNARISNEKTKLTENAVITDTCVPMEGGGKVTVRMKIPFHGANCYICNLPSVNLLPESFRTRLHCQQIPRTTRLNHSAMDKNAYSAMEQYTTDGMKAAIKRYFCQLQIHTFLVGTACELGAFMSPNFTAFSLVTKQVNMALRKVGMSLDPRLIEQAKIIARVSMHEANYLRSTQTPHGRHIGTKIPVTIPHLFDEQHSWEAEMICSEAMAINALLQMLGRFRQGTTYQVAKAIMWLIQQGEYKFSKMFNSRNTSQDRYNPRDSNNEQYSVDLNYVRFSVSKENGLLVFATKLSQALSDSINTSITPTQVIDVLQDMAKLGEMEHNMLDMKLQINADYQLDPRMQHIDLEDSYTLIGWINASKDAGVPLVIDPTWLDNSKASWKKAGYPQEEENLASAFFPRMTRDSEEEVSQTVTHAVCSLDFKNTGMIKISTAFLLRASAKGGFVTQFDKVVDEALRTTMASPRTIATVPQDMMSQDPNLPYLCDMRSVNTGSQQPSITNQDFVNESLYNKISSTDTRPAFRASPVRNFKWYVPIDTQCTEDHLRKWSEKYPYSLPTAHQLLRSDPSAMSRTFAPQILDELEKCCHPFRVLLLIRTKIAFEEKKRLAAAYLERHYIDLMRHHVDGVVLQNTPEADIRCEEFILKTAHHVADLSLATGIGHMRLTALNLCEDGHMTTELRNNQKIASMMEAAEDGDISDAPCIDDDDDFNLVLEQMRYASREDVANRIKELEEEQKSNRDTRKSSTMGNTTTGATFLEAWRNVPKKGVHKGDQYIKYIRASGKRMMDEREKRDGEWMRIKREAAQAQ